jgi:hypothetical protein
MKALKLGLKLAAVAGLSTLLSVSAYAGIENSKHDLRGTATGGGVKITNATEICAFCHTPHGASADTTAPLWNRVVASNQTAYSTATLDGTVVLTDSPSLACLSCHDGQQAMNTVINAPSTAAAVGTPSNYNYVASGIDFVGTTDTLMVGGDALGQSGVAFLGTDLTNDHPVALPYAGGGITGVASDGSKDTSLMADPDFKTTNLKVDEIGGATAWWVDTTVFSNTVGNGRQKTDLILYARDDTNVGYVECATCHDPHNGPSGTTEVQAFLRMGDNAGSQVCLACHNK